MKNIILAALLLPSLCFAENLFKNGGMDTSSGWKGDRKYVPLDGSRVIMVKANKRKAVSFGQTVGSRDVTDFYLTYRYKSFNYKGRGFKLSGTRDNGSSTFNTYDLKADGKWHKMKKKFTEVEGSRNIKFTFTILEGKGEVFFDDIYVDVKEAD